MLASRRHLPIPDLIIVPSPATRGEAAILAHEQVRSHVGTLGTRYRQLVQAALDQPRPSAALTAALRTLGKLR